MFSYEWHLKFRSHFLVNNDVMGIWLNTMGGPASSACITNYFGRAVFELSNGFYKVLWIIVDTRSLSVAGLHSLSGYSYRIEETFYC